MWIGGVRVIILNEKNEMLMVRQQHEGKDIWMVPGGSIEQGETSFQAAVREVKEETGLSVCVGELIWHIEEVAERGMRFVNFFLGSVNGGEPILGTDPEFGIDGQVLREVKYVSKEELAELETVYPPYLKDEFWEILKNYRRHQPYKVRKAL